MRRRKITQREFDRIIAQSDSRESFRGQLYEIGLGLLRSGHEIEAYLLILATWNFARFRYFIKTFNLQRFRDAIAATEPHFARLADSKFATANFDNIAEDIAGIYDMLNAVAEQTGASKIMHFRHPELFVMWDTDIRKNWRLRSSAQDYIEFHKRLQSEFGHLAWARKDKTFARAIDQFNYSRAHGGDRARE